MRQQWIEQDEAAGGHETRRLRLSDGEVVIASVGVRAFPKTPNKRYGYLQFKHRGRTVNKYIGKVTAESRAESLSIGWALLRSRKLVEANGWEWVKVRK